MSWFINHKIDRIQITIVDESSRTLFFQLPYVGCLYDIYFDGNSKKRRLAHLKYFTTRQLQNEARKN